MYIYEAKVKVEREILGAKYWFSLVLDPIHNLIVLYSRVLQSFPNISSTFYTYTGVYVKRDKPVEPPRRVLKTWFKVPSTQAQPQS